MHQFVAVVDADSAGHHADADDLTAHYKKSRGEGHEIANEYYRVVADPSDGTLTVEDLRGRWTILACWGLWSEDSISDVRYMQALRSAAGQDPDLDFRAIHTPPPRTEDQQPSEAPYGAYLSLSQGLADQGAPFPTAEDTQGALARTLNITSAPTYLLIGPDLAIEAKRGAIGPDNTDGIKSMIRGVAEIRSQIASP